MVICRLVMTQRRVLCRATCPRDRYDARGGGVRVEAWALRSPNLCQSLFDR
jgi:hypothetical protein